MGQLVVAIFSLFIISSQAQESYNLSQETGWTVTAGGTLVLSSGILDYFASSNKVYTYNAIVRTLEDKSLASEIREFDIQIQKLERQLSRSNPPEVKAEWSKALNTLIEERQEVVELAEELGLVRQQKMQVHVDTTMDALSIKEFDRQVRAAYKSKNAYYLGHTVVTNVVTNTSKKSFSKHLLRAKGVKGLSKIKGGLIVMVAGSVVAIFSEYSDDKLPDAAESYHSLK